MMMKKVCMILACVFVGFSQQLVVCSQQENRWQVSVAAVGTKGDYPIFNGVIGVANGYLVLSGLSAQKPKVVAPNCVAPLSEDLRAVLQQNLHKEKSLLLEDLTKLDGEDQTHYFTVSNVEMLQSLLGNKSGMQKEKMSRRHSAPALRLKGSSGTNVSGDTGAGVGLSFKDMDDSSLAEDLHELFNDNGLQNLNKQSENKTRIVFSAMDSDADVNGYNQAVLEQSNDQFKINIKDNNANEKVITLGRNSLSRFQIAVFNLYPQGSFDGQKALLVTVENDDQQYKAALVISEDVYNQLSIQKMVDLAQAISMQGDDPLHIKNPQEQVKKSGSWLQSTTVKFLGTSVFVLAAFVAAARYFDVSWQDFTKELYGFNFLK